MINELILQSKDIDKTKNLGETIGQNLKGGEVIELISDLGGGKTTLTKAIVKGSGSINDVTSPTFTIRNDYTTNNGLKIAHYDFYRLGEDIGIIKQMLKETISETSMVNIIEWASKEVESLLPVRHVQIYIKVASLKSREFIIKYPNKFNYLFSNLSK